MSKENTYKLKVDLRQGTFEAEGTQDFIETKYNEFKSIIEKKKTLISPSVTEIESSITSPTRKKVKKKRAASNNRKASIAKDLNLMPRGKESLKDFYEKKSPDTNLKRNAVFAYYLKEILELGKPITIDHIYTCYKSIDALRMPKNIFQSISDAGSRRYGFLDTSDGYEDIKLTSVGENLVRHDLPLKK